MKNLFAQVRFCGIMLLLIHHSSNLLAMKGDSLSINKDDTLTLTLKVKPGDYVYPQVLDSLLIYSYQSDNDSILMKRTVYYQDDDLRDTAIYTFDYDTVNNVWLKTSKQEINYNNGDNNPSEKTYEWNEVLQRWINKTWRRRVVKSTLNVDARYEWNAIINDWVGERIDSTILEDGHTKSKFVADGVDQDNEWIPSYQQEYEYKYLKDTTETTINNFSYDSQEQVLKPGTKNTSIEINGKIHSRTYLKREDDLLVFDRMYKYEYNNNGDITLYETYEYDQELESWELTDFREYQYNFKSEQIQNIWHRWNNAANSLLPYQKYERTYSNEGVTQTIRYSWNVSSNDWIPQSKTNITYTDGNYAQVVESDWDDVNLEWDVVSRNVYEYNEEGRRTLESEFETNKIETEEESEVRRYENAYETINGVVYTSLYYYYRWNNSLERLTGNYGYKYTYNEHGRVTEAQYFIWNTAEEGWSLGNRSVYYHSKLPGESESPADTVFVQDTIVLPSDTLLVRDTIYMDLDTINVVIYDTVKVIDTVTITITDTALLSGIETNKSEEKTIMMYPNPAKDYLFFENPYENNLSYAIHAMDGRKLMEGILRGRAINKRINVGDFKPGFYTILFYDQNNFYKQLRFIKQ